MRMMRSTERQVREKRAGSLSQSYDTVAILYYGQPTADDSQ